MIDQGINIYSQGAFLHLQHIQATYKLSYDSKQQLSHYFCSDDKK